MQKESTTTMGTNLSGFVEVRDHNRVWNFLGDLSPFLTRHSYLHSYLFQLYDDGMWIYDETKPSLIPERGLPEEGTVDAISVMGKCFQAYYSAGYRQSWAWWSELQAVSFDEVLSLHEHPYDKEAIGWKTAWELLRVWATFFDQERYPLRLIIWFS